MTYLLRCRRSYIYFLITLFTLLTAIAQEENTHHIPDSLSGKTYDYLYNKVLENPTDTIASLTYFNTYLAKAIDGGSNLDKLNGHINLSYYTKNKEAKLNLINNALLDIQDISDEDLVSTYIYAGTAYHDYFDYETAVTYYLKALKIAQDYNSKRVESAILNNIAKIKEDVGKHKEALPLYKKCYAYEMSKRDTIAIIGTTINIAESMRHNKMHDSASYYYHAIIDRAYKESPSYGNLATINEGINLFYKKKYVEAEKLLLKGYSQMDFSVGSQKHHILAILYLGKIQLALYNDEEKAKANFIKVDSLASETEVIIPNTIEAYEYLIRYYEKKEDLKKQLDAVIKLSKLRATISSRKINTVDMLYSEFDTPQLLKNKEALIQQLKQKETTNSIQIVYLIIFILFLIILFILQYNKHKKYRNQFNSIISELDNQDTKSNSNHDASDTSNLLLEGINEITITTILQKLDQFEKQKGFLQKDITLAILAKKCGTNTKYLPKIIHVYKDKSFVNYINYLRIDYILKELRENTTLQKYTIKTISEEAGFNTAESFSRAFKNKTGIRPSYYIRNLKKELSNDS
ncbi:helix-turn-helix domain-containing protein [uncultured Dokdonia sp.]|uniref:helix-turn-helix domain-containing protein n=1 Tax=uncultured Dokdonia sp. TaxID=575653 RepID=UPI0026283796|nr:helix-turn-helix domain-containing protein [uncultured Dokdonia sp.]